MALIDYHTTETGILFHLPSELTIRFGSLIWAEILEKEIQNWIFDLKNVSRIDTSGVQILIGAKKLTSLQGKNLSLINHSEAVLRTWDILGLVSYFGDKVKIKKSELNYYSFKYGMKK